MSKKCEICKQVFDGCPIVLPCCGYEVCRKHLTTDSAKSESKSEEVCQICADPLNIESVFKLKRNQIKIRKFEEDQKIKKYKSQFENLKRICQEIETNKYYCMDSLKKFTATIDKRKEELLNVFKKQELKVIDEYDKLMTEIELHRVESNRIFTMKVSEAIDFSKINLKSDDSTVKGLEKNIHLMDKRLGKVERIKDIFDIHQKYKLDYSCNHKYQRESSNIYYNQHICDNADYESPNFNFNFEQTESILGKLSKYVYKINNSNFVNDKIYEIKSEENGVIISVHWKSIKKWNFYTGQLIGTYNFGYNFFIFDKYSETKHVQLLKNNQIICLCIYNDKKRIAKCDSYEIKFLEYLNNHDTNIKSFEVLDNDEIAVAYSDGSIKIYDINSEMCLKSFCLQGNLNKFVVLASNEIICNTGYEITIWDKDTCQCKTKIKAQGSNSFNHFIVDNCNIYCQESTNDKSFNISIWDKQSGALSKQISICCKERGAIQQFIKLGDYICCLHACQISHIMIYNVNGSLIKDIQIINEKKEELKVLGHKVTFTCMHVLNYDQIVAGDSNGELTIWEVKTGNCIKKFNDKQCDETSGKLGISCIESLDNTHIITGSNYNDKFQYMTVWNIQSGECENL